MKKNPWVAAAASLVPGLGQIYTGRPKKGLALLCVAAGAVVSLVITHSRIFFILTILIYFATVIPAGIEAFQEACGFRCMAFLDSKRYVVWMLLTTGFSALPLLWHSGQFSRPAKIAWTVAVPILAFIFFAGLVFLAPKIDIFLKKN